MHQGEQFNKKEEGSWGEEVACRFLEQRGFTIIHRNWRWRHLELDIVARRGGECHVIEVKTRSLRRMPPPHELLKAKQVRALIEATHRYAKANPWMEDLSIDLVTIATSKEQPPLVTLYERAVVPSF